MPNRRGDHRNDYGSYQPQKTKSNSSSSTQPPPNMRQTTTFSDDVAAKHRALGRHERRSRQEEQQQQQQQQQQQRRRQQQLPGPVRVPGIGASSVASHKSYDSKREDSNRDDSKRSKDEDSKRSKEDNSNLLTAIPVEDDDEQLDELEKQRIEDKAKHDVRLKIVAGAVEAEVADIVAEEKERDQKKCRRMMIYGCLVLVLLIGGGAAVGVALSSSAPPEETESPTMEPTTSPTVRPPIFVGLPAQNSTEPQIGDAPFQSPPPDNTVCEGAFDIATQIGTPFFGDIPALARVAPVDTCEVIFRNGVGVWYRFLGDGSRYSASTCNATAFDTQISIFRGACGKLQCVAGNDQMERCGNGDQSLVGFPTEPGVNYYLYVQARRQSQGLFNLLVDYLDSNDECEGAIPLEFYGRSVFGSTRGATVDNVECFGQVPDAPGVWYTVQGDEWAFEFRAVYDTSDTAFSSPRTMVFTGDGCGSLTCVANGNSWFVQGESLAAETYYILVYGREEGSEGDYRILVDDGIDLAFSIQPSLPIILFPGAVATDSTFAASIPPFGSCGNQVFATADGAWFEAIGTGAPLTVSTCNTTTGFDTQISVLQGSSFDDLICVDGNDQACGDQSSVSWFSEVDVRYYISVHGYATHVGSFTITLEETDIAVSATCESALPLEPDGVSVLGSTENILSALAPSCGFTPSNGPGVWYLVMGTGQSMTVSTCLSPDNMFTTITIFGDGCDGLGCVEIIKSPCGTHHAATWNAEVGAEYYVLVQSQDSSGSGGNFVLTAEETAPNDLCENAIGPLGADGTYTYGSTRSATADTLASRTRGIWYTVLGTGTELIASTCSEFTDFSTSLSIYQGSGACETLTPVITVASPGNCAFGSIQSWSSVEDEVYYVLLSGVLPNDFGNFALRLSSFP